MRFAFECLQQQQQQSKQQQGQFDLLHRILVTYVGIYVSMDEYKRNICDIWAVNIHIRTYFHPFHLTFPHSSLSALHPYVAPSLYRRQGTYIRMYMAAAQWWFTRLVNSCLAVAVVGAVVSIAAFRSSAVLIVHILARRLHVAFQSDCLVFAAAFRWLAWV